MNSRSENYQSPFTKDVIIKSLEGWAREPEENGITSLEIIRQDDNHVEYEVECDDALLPVYKRSLYFPESETLETFGKRVLVDPRAADIIDKDTLIRFMYNCIDANALMCVNHVAVVYPNEEGRSFARNWLEAEFMDEYAQYACESGMGLTWCERSVVIVNMEELLNVAAEAARDECDDGIAYNFGSAFHTQFHRALFPTLIHEFRHVAYELNEILPYGEDYPEEGGEEESVEEWCRDQYESGGCYEGYWDNIIKEDALLGCGREWLSEHGLNPDEYFIGEDEGEISP